MVLVGARGAQTAENRTGIQHEANRGDPGRKARPSAPGGNRYMCPGEPLSSLSGPDSRMGPVGWRVPPGTAQPNSEGGEGGRKEDKPEASPGSSQGWRLTPRVLEPTGDG